jgi:hypothetical protein
MDTGIAAIIASIVTAAASIAVALITTRARIDVVPEKPVQSTPPNADPPDRYAPYIPIPIEPPRPVDAKRSSVQIYRAIGWFLVGVLYFTASFFLIVAIYAICYAILNGEFAANFAMASVLTLISLCPYFIARWARKRLKRSTSPQSN